MLVVSYIGYVTKEVDVAGRSVITVTLEPDSEQLDEVVVTALGIEREKKSLGYASQELDNEEVVQAREPNLLNSLSGKVIVLLALVVPPGSPSGGMPP